MGQAIYRPVGGGGGARGFELPSTEEMLKLLVSITIMVFVILIYAGEKDQTGEINQLGDALLDLPVFENISLPLPPDNGTTPPSSGPPSTPPFPPGTIIDIDIKPGETSSIIDAFGRLKTSAPTTLFEMKHSSLELNYNMWYSVINTLNAGHCRYDQACDPYQSTKWTGGSVEASNDAFVNMSVFQPNRRVVYQSRVYIPYQPGKSRLTLMTGVLCGENGFPPNATARMGVFDDADDKVTDNVTRGNGFFIELGDGGIFLVKRDDSTDTRIPQSEWNIDSMNGTGPSNVTLDFSKAFIFYMDQEWLGVGSVRLGFVYDNVIIVAHIFRHTARFHAPYTSTPDLPLRYELTSGGSFTGTAEMRAICGSVMSEGGFRPSVVTHSHIVYEAFKTLAASRTWYNTLLIMPNIVTGTQRPRTVVTIERLSLTPTSASPVLHWRLVRVHYENIPAATASATKEGSIGGISHVRFYEWQGTDHNTYTPDTVLDDVVLTDSSSARSTSVVERTDDATFGTFTISSSISGMPSAFLLQALSTSGNDDCTTSLTFNEIQN